MNYLLNLNFYPGELTFGPSLQRKRLYWTFCSYMLLALGILARQCVPISAFPLTFSFSNMRPSVALASLIVATALFPPFTRWFNKQIKKPSWPQVLWAFSFGFFVDLSNKVVAGIFRLAFK
jgi:hypothetical protein